MLPTAGLRLQVTAVLELLATVAVKLWVCDWPRVTLAGVSETLTGGVRETVAVAVFVVSAELVAFTITVWTAEIVAGAV
jgi:hypothetical protein